MKFRRGEIPAALQETDLGLQRFPSKETEWHWRFQVLKAQILDVQGKEREALSLLQEELPPSLGTSELAVRRKYTQGSANASMGLLKEADGELAEAEALARSYHPELLGEVALMYGTVQFIKGAAPAAEAAYRKARELAREEKDSFLEAAALSGLGVATTMEGHYDESIDWNRAAAELARSVRAAGSLARTLGNTGWNYAELGDFENALKFYEQAERVAADNGLTASRTGWLASVAYAYQGLGDDARAEGILKQVLELARNQDSKETLVQCLNQLTWIALRTGRIERAEEYNREASGLAKERIGPRIAIESLLLLGAIAANKRDYKDAESSYTRVIQEQQASKFQQWKAQAELANVYAAEGLDEKAEKEYRVSLATIEEARASISTPELRLSFLFNTIRFYSDFVEFLVSKQRIEDALQVVELSRARTLAEGLGTVPKTLSFPLRDFRPQRVARRRNAVLLDYWLAPQQSYLWVIMPTKISCLTIAKQSEVEALVNKYRGAMQDGKDLLAGGGVAGQQLYSTLVEPAKELIPPHARVIVLPDAGLYRLNFETLITAGPEPHYWIEDVTVSTASSLTLLDSTAPAPARKEKSLLIIGNTEQTSSDFPVLAQAPQEMKDIEKHFPGDRLKVLEGKEATQKAYLESHPERFSYIHFVTHGTASVTHPLESAIIVSSDGSSYKLYARDIVQHHINAELVTISACNGAGARPYSGEGLVGLSWAFVRAGAHNVISALWDVSDASAPELMDSMYAELTQGKDPATALHDAKLAMLHGNASNVFRKPFYWAPFQIYAGS